MGFMAGAAREDITPRVGCNLFGYRSDILSESVTDELTVTALALSTEDEKAILLSATLCVISPVLSTRARAIIEAETGVPASRVVLAATHTHTGPITSSLPGWGEADEGYIEDIFLPAVARAARAAWAAREPAELGIGTTRSEIGVNRRQLAPDGTVTLGQNPFGLFDPTMTVLSFRAETGKGILNLVHYGVHNTAAGAAHTISRDLAGVMIDRVEAETGTLTCFFNGLEGDVGPRIANGESTGDMRHVIEIGGVAAIDAMRAFRAIKEYRRDLTLRAAAGTMRIPLCPRMSGDEARRRLAEFEVIPTQNIEKAIYEMLRLLVYLDERDAPQEPSVENEQTLIALGPIVFVPFASEAFSEISLRLRAYSPFAHTLCLSNANGNDSYLPSRDQIARGGYEVQVFRWRAVQNLPDNTDDLMITQILALMENLR